MKKRLVIFQINSDSLEKKEYIETLPEYYALAAVTENGSWHNHQNTLHHVTSVFKNLELLLRFENKTDRQKKSVKAYLSTMVGTKTRKEILIVATLLHDIGKVDTLLQRLDGSSSCPGHELVGAARVKNFTSRFGLNDRDESYVERIVRYHGFIYQTMELIDANGKKDKYFAIFTDTVGDIALELVLLMHADLLGSDLKTLNKKGFDFRVQLLEWMFDQLLVSCSVL